MVQTLEYAHLDPFGATKVSETGTQKVTLIGSAIAAFAASLCCLGPLVLVGLGALMILLPLSGAGSPDEPAPPTAMM